MDQFIVKKIADYFRVMRIDPKGGKTVVSSHRTEKSARSAMLKLSQAERQARIRRNVLIGLGCEP
jgi:hypothetical protein